MKFNETVNDETNNVHSSAAVLQLSFIYFLFPFSSFGDVLYSSRLEDYFLLVMGPHSIIVLRQRGPGSFPYHRVFNFCHTNSKGLNRVRQTKQELDYAEG